MEHLASMYNQHTVGCLCVSISNVFQTIAQWSRDSVLFCFCVFLLSFWGFLHAYITSHERQRHDPRTNLCRAHCLEELQAW